MTDESCACSKVVLSPEKHPGGLQSEMHECAACGARFVRAVRVLLSPQREQTAATILAALTEGRMVGKGGTLDDADLDNVRYAVALADALRAELAKNESSMRGQREQERR